VRKFHAANDVADFIRDKRVLTKFEIKGWVLGQEATSAPSVTS
jgi:hypothetical protein